jgi:DNA-binding CsgD family transcriptional regulator
MSPIALNALHAPAPLSPAAVDSGWHFQVESVRDVRPQHPPPRAGHGTPPAWLAATLEHVGRGLIVVASLGRVVHANRLARQALEAAGHPLRIDEGVLHARHADDANLLRDALDAAQRRGLRRLLELSRGDAGSAAAPTALAVLPLPADALGPGTGGTALVSLPMAPRTRDLALEAYARLCELTTAETTVLEALAAGDSPADIARDKGVALCTVRTQICQLRLKTGCHSIRQLVQRVLGLPPMVGVVQ